MRDFAIGSVRISLDETNERDLRLASTNNGSIYVQVICEDQTINEHAEVSETRSDAGRKKKKKERRLV